MDLQFLLKDLKRLFSLGAIPQLDLSTQLTKNLFVLILDASRTCARVSVIVFNMVANRGIESLMIMEIEE